MITWMQRHRKYLIITMWISGGAFIAAGPMFAIGSSSFSGRSADTVATVGNINVTVQQMNTVYRQIFNQYNQMFQGKFDEAQAKAFGLEQQALRQLINETLLLNLAEEFKLRVSDEEVTDNLLNTDAFQKDGKFDKETYEKVLKQARLTMLQYEQDIRRALLLQKIVLLIQPKALPLEQEALDTAMYVSDKVEYKVLDTSMISIDATDEALKTYWEQHQLEYMREPAFALEMIEHTPIQGEFSEADIEKTYAANKHTYTNEKGEIKSLEEAKEAVLADLNKEFNNKEALRTYIAYKKSELDANITTSAVTISASNNPYTQEVLTKVQKLTLEKPFMKPVEVDGKFLIFKLVKATGAEPKSFEEAKAEAKTDYLTEQNKLQLQTLAKNSVETFKGKASDFLTRESISKLAPLSEVEASEFLEQLMTKQTKRGYIEIKGGKIVLYNILEQKLLRQDHNAQERNVLRLKTSLMNDGLLKKLEAQYPVTSYLEGK